MEEMKLFFVFVLKAAQCTINNEVGSQDSDKYVFLLL